MRDPHRGHTKLSLAFKDVRGHPTASPCRQDDAGDGHQGKKQTTSKKMPKSILNSRRHAVLLGEAGETQGRGGREEAVAVCVIWTLRPSHEAVAREIRRHQVTVSLQPD